jgi:hypothetical protein
MPKADFWSYEKSSGRELDRDQNLLSLVLLSGTFLISVEEIEIQVVSHIENLFSLAREFNMALSARVNTDSNECTKFDQPRCTNQDHEYQSRDLFDDKSHKNKGILYSLGDPAPPL